MTIKQFVFLICAIFFSFSLGYSQEVPKEISKFHACTVANRPHPGLDLLLHSAKKKGISIDVLGMHKDYPGHGQKLIWVQEYISQFPDEDIVLFVDAFDVLILEDKETIIKKFLEKQVPFIISAEKNCYPSQWISLYPPGPTPFRFINSGSYIGYVGHIRKLFSSMPIEAVPCCDQGQFARHFVNHPNDYTLDYYCDLFLPLYQVESTDLIVDHQNGSVVCTITGSYPSIVHRNGYGNGYPAESAWKEIIHCLTR